MALPALSLRSHGSALVFAAATVLLVVWALLRQYQTDLQLHLWLLGAHLEVGSFPVPPLYYAAVHAVSLLLPVGGAPFAAALVLGAAAYWKFQLLRSPLDDALGNKGHAAGAAVWCLLIAGPIVIRGLNAQWYLGTLSTAVLTNSTTLLVLPFCLWLHFLSLRYVHAGGVRHLWLMFLVGTLVLLTKPSYLFAQLPVLPLFALMERRSLDRRVLGIGAYVLGMGVLLAVLYKKVYSSGELDAIWYGGVASHVTMAPFKVWLLWTRTPFLKAFLSVVFVIAFVVHDPGAWKRSAALRFAGALFVVALLIFVLMAETGRRETHGNFYWQVPITLLILHFTMVHELALQGWPPLRGRFAGLSVKDRILLLAATAHVLCGAAYIARFILTGIYV